MNEVDLAQLLTDLGPVGLFALFIVVLIRGRHIVLRRELDRCELRLQELKAERDEFKFMALKAVGLGERLADVVKEGPS